MFQQIMLFEQQIPEEREKDPACQALMLGPSLLWTVFPWMKGAGGMQGTDSSLRTPLALLDSIFTQSADSWGRHRLSSN